ncbi:MAG: hypothetical protein Q8L14_27360 [Myxococcales bacterium]|nr:hypothetical protein [Myxococcales bacterium]
MNSNVISLVGLVGFVSCGRPELPPDRDQSVGSPIAQAPDAGTVDAGDLPFDAGTPDAGQSELDAGSRSDAGTVTDAGAPLTWERDTKPLFDRHCTRCHESGNWGIPSFADRYPDLLLPSKLCVGENVGTCVSRAVQVQRTEGTGCRTYETPFHREGWSCLSPEAVDVIVRWVDGGMIER